MASNIYSMEIPWLLPALYWIVGVAFGYAFQNILARLKMKEAERTARQTIEDAKREADALVREGRIQAKDEMVKAREAFEKEAWMRRQEFKTTEDRINQRESALDQKNLVLDRKEQVLELKLNELQQERETLGQKAKDLDQMIQSELGKLAEISGMKTEEARRQLLARIEESVRHDASELIRRLQEEARQTADKQAREIMATAIERYAADHVNEATTATVHLPSEEMKGRIIGREGRNIRALEHATGVNFLIDDTPEVVVLSSFDPVRREVARQTLLRLIEDGRIHPARIEEVVAKVQAELDESTRVSGEEAVYGLKLDHIDPAVIFLLGKLKFRYSYGQNVLKHSVEMAHLMGMMAAELRLDAAVAKRVGLFHDIGKAMEQLPDSSHALAGAEFLKKHGEPPVVVNAVAAHHDEVPGESIYAVLCKAGDAITASRPGARAETTEIYLKRLERLESLANAHRGVERSFAIQAGREIRVIVEPSSIDDDGAVQLARDLSKEIEQELDYPGQIKVTVIRETRCVEYAR